ncbi:MAG: hypothetical protein AVDCRST_MAG49-2513 [uncultured Thermomicrobiales bacterium]|uniref:DUF305 domain-containing protein n=1 Tax=uncultured Thermomicrobiales bacterium TaxID=1645740 RepID=A0A6J4UTJ7_9BACT|nr:MAG: hypothetical protein AVDCRST_MAG49-2513 [uncultured Thermomicrobiales bacterium]
MHRTTRRRPILVALLLAATLAATLAGIVAATGAAADVPRLARQATPVPADPCDPTAATPTSGMDHGAMGHGTTDQGATPTAAHGSDHDAEGHGTTGHAASPTAAAGHGHDMGAMAVEFDQMYLDMMIPHHAAILAMAEAALPRLENAELRAIAQQIIDTQGPEIEELRGYRERFYGSPDPMPMDDAMMGTMGDMMPSVSVPMDEMMAQMDAATQVAALCAAADPDLAFIDLTIPHHQSAIEASRDALTMATHPEIREVAQRVIDAQEAEIAALTRIRAELTGGATPAAAADAIQALTPDEVAQIERGEGAGLALPAEANGIPGPRHALDLGSELGLTAAQTAELQAIFDAMRGEAILAGERYLAAQAALETDLRTGAIGTVELSVRVEEVSRLRGELATVHLQAHLTTRETLTPEQVATYNRLRGHTG